MSRLVLGVIGHVDHGKTALVRALTGQETDRLAEEQRRGISIALGFAHFTAGPDTEVDLIDMPGHERFVRTMIAGATGIDAVLLVVAANEGVRAQTLEHVDIASLLGLRQAVVAVSKADLVAPGQAARVAEEAARLLERCGLDPLPPVATSALDSRGIAELRQALATLAKQHRPRTADGLAFLPIDRAFSIPGHGPVATGTLRGATVSVGDVLELLPSRQEVRVKAAEVHGIRVPTARPGQRVALNLRDIETSALKRGKALATPGSLPSSEWLTMRIRAVATAAPLRNGMRLRALAGTGELDTRLRLLDCDTLEAGDSGFAQLHCATPVALPAGEHLILRLPSPAATVAGGRLLEPAAGRRRRNDPQVIARLQDLRALAPAELMAAEVRRCGPAGTSLRHLSQLCALGTPRVLALLRALPVVVTASGWVVSRDLLDSLLARIPALLEPLAGGLARAKLLAALPGTGPEVLEEALRRLQVANAVIERGGRLLVPRPEADMARVRAEAELAARIAALLRRARLTPPAPAEIVTDPVSRGAVARLLRAGVIVHAVDRAKGREMLFHRDAIEEARRRLAPLLEGPAGLRVTEIGAALGISRKYCMPLLDHLDAIRFTRRIQDRRVRAAAARDTSPTITRSGNA